MTWPGPEVSMTGFGYHKPQVWGFSLLQGTAAKAEGRQHGRVISQTLGSCTEVWELSFCWELLGNGIQGQASEMSFYNTQCRLLRGESTTGPLRNNQCQYSVFLSLNILVSLVIPSLLFTYWFHVYIHMYVCMYVFKIHTHTPMWKSMSWCICSPWKSPAFFESCPAPGPQWPCGNQFLRQRICCVHNLSFLLNVPLVLYQC